jgi:hypothetical protein
MSQLKIGLREERTRHEPGDEIVGAAGWEFARPPEAMELRLFWFTRGKGDEDAGVVATQRMENPAAAEARPFQFRLPEAPYSFCGALMTLKWAVELVALPSKEAARVEFDMAPGGDPVVLS